MHPMIYRYLIPLELLDDQFGLYMREERPHLFLVPYVDVQPLSRAHAAKLYYSK